MKKIKFKLFKKDAEIVGADRLRSMALKLEEIRALKIKIVVVEE